MHDANVSFFKCLFICPRVIFFKTVIKGGRTAFILHMGKFPVKLLSLLIVLQGGIIADASQPPLP